MTSEQRSSGKRSNTFAGTGARNVGSTPRLHAILTDHCQCTDEMDCSTCSLVHLSPQVKRCTVPVLSSYGWSISWNVAWKLVNLCLLTFQRWEKGLGISRRSWLTDGNPPCGWARATSRTCIGSEPTKDLLTSEVYDNSPSTAGRK